MVYGIVQLINFAHGDIIMVGGYMVYLAMATAGLPIWLALPFSILVCALAGLIIQRVAYRRLLVHNAARISLLITALGVSIFLQNLFMLLFTPDPKTMPTLFGARPVDVGHPDQHRGVGAADGRAAAAGPQDQIGKAMQATSEDTGAAKLMGINTNSVVAFTFAIGSALAAVGAILYCNSYPQIKPDMGNLLGLKAFVAAVLGGIGSIPGAMLGGYVLGVVESLTKAYISTTITDAVVFAILILVLLVKPTGLLGKNRKEKV